VPIRHDQPGSGTIDLAFVRLRSRAAAPTAPLIYLDGGPGGAGYTAAMVPEYVDLFERLRATRDVILLSQRGTGLSRPHPSCTSEGLLPDSFMVSVDSMAAELGGRAKRCADSLKQKGLDLAAFNTEESAADVVVLQRALGVPRVALLGFSYGTHLALAVVRRAPDAIERVVLAGTEGPNDTWKLPSVMDAQLEKLSQQSGGELAATWQRLLASAAEKPLAVPITSSGQTRTIAIGPAGLQYLLRRDVGDTNDWPLIPLLMTQAASGDLTALGRLAARRVGGLSAGLNLMPMAMDCASGATADRLARIRALEPSPAFGRMTNYPYPDACAVIGVPMLPDSFRTPIKSAVPALFISGTLDSNTPPAQADAVATGFANAAHIVVENAGHESTFQPIAVREAVQAFLEGNAVKSSTVAAPAIRFRSQ
jgi:pimeloyl-ACP methyl ester carboxylesterase